MERGGGEDAEVLELLRLAQELQSDERVGCRCGDHGVGGGGKVGDRRRKGGVHGGTGELRRPRFASGPSTVGLVWIGTGRVEGPHGCAGFFGRRGGQDRR